MTYIVRITYGTGAVEYAHLQAWPDQARATHIRHIDHAELLAQVIRCLVPSVTTEIIQVEDDDEHLHPSVQSSDLD